MIYPFGNSTSLPVYCDLTTAGGGWLVSGILHKIHQEANSDQRFFLVHNLSSSCTKHYIYFNKNSNSNRYNDNNTKTAISIQFRLGEHFLHFLISQTGTISNTLLNIQKLTQQKLKKTSKLFVPSLGLRQGNINLKFWKLI